MRNAIAIQRGLILVPAATEENTRLAASLQAELMNLGFMLDEGAFAAARNAPAEWLVAYFTEVIPHLRKRLGADRNYQPFYGNFPTEVMEMSNLALFFNAIVHYWSGGTWEPPQVLRDRGFAFENVRFKPVRSGTDSDLKQIFTQLVSINQSLTEQDKQTLAWLLETYKGDLTLPDVIPFKETLCILAASGLDVPVRTATDVLRIAVYLSAGDISLPGVPKPTPIKTRPGLQQWHLDQLRKAQQQARDKFKFKKFSRPQRRLILGLLEKAGPDVTEMQRHLGRWLRLGEILHVGEHAKHFPRSAQAFQKLRNQRKGTRIRTFSARVNLAFAEDWRKGVDLLATRPGEFARRLDWMLRKFERAYVLDAFARTGPQVSSKVLFELYNHFAQRFKSGSPRAIVIKGVRAKTKTLPPLPPMDADLVQHVGNAILRIMRNRIGSLPPLGKVWIDERLKEVPVPFAMRSVNSAVKTYVRGTRIPFAADAKVVRAFIHWYDPNGNEDLDLSAGLYDESLKLVSHVSFTNLKDARVNCCHSGDIRHRQGPCAEYIDLDIQSCQHQGVRYAIIQVFNYNARPMHSVKDCVFGLMEREHPVANEVFVPKTISNCTALANESTSVAICNVDLEKRNYIWADVESQRVLPTLENAASGSADVLRSLIHGTKMPLFELLTLHAQERGTPVSDESDADVVFRWDDFVTDYSKAATFMTF